MSVVPLDFLSVQSMTALLTAPYRRGAETQVIALGIDNALETTIPLYDFHEYQSRHGALPPAPKYVLFPRVDIGADGLTVEVDYQGVGPAGTATVAIPPRTFAGTSFIVSTPANAGAALRIMKLRQKP